MLALIQIVSYFLNMTTNEINKTFLAATDKKTKTAILSAIAAHYGITQTEAFEEVIHEEAEHLLDYLTGNIRTATSLLMKRHNLAA
jgi:hypothetical protein